MTDDVMQSVITWIGAAQSGSAKMEISAETSIAEKQLLDSLQIMDLVMHLETSFSISVPLDALTEDNFSSPKAITTMVHKIKAGV